MSQRKCLRRLLIGMMRLWRVDDLVCLYRIPGSWSASAATHGLVCLPYRRQRIEKLPRAEVLFPFLLSPPCLTLVHKGLSIPVRLCDRYLGRQPNRRRTDDEIPLEMNDCLLRSDANTQRHNSGATKLRDATEYVEVMCFE